LQGTGQPDIIKFQEYMDNIISFKGFPRETVTFLKNLAANNDKAWFEKNRAAYETDVMGPARLFVRDMGGALEKIAPGVVADPRVNGSIFKIHRDVRFGRDKTPFKTNLGLWFWEGERKRMECSGFYFHLEPETFMAGVGMYMFSPGVLKLYREAVIHPKKGDKLHHIINTIIKKGGYSPGGSYYKKVPCGFDPGHKNAELLRYNGIWAGRETKIPEEFFSEILVQYCLKIYKDLLPLHRWLLNL